VSGAGLATITGYAWGRAVELLPWFALAIVLAALASHVRLDLLLRRDARHRTGAAVLAATAVGAFTPLCSCSVVPLVRGLLRAGIPASSAMAFWIASPAMAPELFGLTARGVGLPIATARLVGVLALGLGSAGVTRVLETRGLLTRVLREQPTAEVPAIVMPEPGCCESAGDATCADGASPRWRDAAVESLRQVSVYEFGRTLGRDAWSLGRWMLAAIVLEAVLVHAAHPASFTALLGGSTLIAVPVAALLSIPLYLNGIAAIPLTAGLISAGMSPAAATTFLIAGAITTLPAAAAVRAIATRTVFAVYLATGLGGAILVGWLTGAFVR
jgi:uncharacterized membrane protein YraQ (UPF0718 family)